MSRLTLAAMALILLAGIVLAQAPKPGQQPANAKQKMKMKTVRLHIDGFQKSRSGAV